MCKSVDKGGLNMISSKDQQKVFLIKWIKRTLEKSMSSSEARHKEDIIFHKLGGVDYFLSASVYSKNISIPPKMTRFWGDVVKTWLEFKNHNSGLSPLDEAEILKEPLFNNINIMYKGRTLFYNKWLSSGIKYVHHLFKNGSMLSVADITQKVGRCPSLVFDYFALINSIPASWKNKLANNSNNGSNDDNANNSVDDPIVEAVRRSSLTLLQQSNRTLREKIVESRTVQICGKNFWLNKMGINICHNYKLAQEATKESRLRLLHFKILHNIYPTNILLNRMGLKETEKCEHCDHIDFIEHLFIHCTRLNGYWDHVFRLIHFKTGIKIPKTNENILFGIKGLESANCQQIKIANHIILIAKMAISKMKFGTIKNVFLLFVLDMEQRNNHIIL